MSPDSTLDKPAVILREKDPLPKRFGLMFGDGIQCLRSCLDYLVHELIEQSGQPHHTQNQFPISLSAKSYKDKLRSHYLDGVSSSAIRVIEGLQPHHATQPEKHPLAILDRLANINKHRRIVLTNFISTTVHPTSELSFPHIRANGRVHSLSTGDSFDAPVWGYVTIKDELLQDEEIITAIEKLSEYLMTQVLPLFKEFFS